MRIIFLGPPGSGKGTQSTLIIKKYKIAQISIGNMLREIAIDKNNTLGKKIKNLIEQGKLVDDYIVCSLIKKRILEKDCKNGFLLDGFPRNINQAIILQQEQINIDFVVEFYITQQMISNRIDGRLVHAISGRTYHKTLNPPINKNLDDITGDVLSTRNDDTIQTLTKRLKEYKKRTQPLIQYYTNLMKFSNLKYFKINGNKKIKDIHNKLINLLSKSN